uniref:Uncharacterized protein n=1 Tax=Vannella robusta TaxID=1487602 RepID=A0A7S4ITY2_9EUKA
MAYDLQLNSSMPVHYQIMTNQDTKASNGKKHIFHPTNTIDTMAAQTKMKKQQLLLRKAEGNQDDGICKNRECSNPSGYASKPNSIYCSTKCQSREQNLRQGRVKNARKPGSPPMNLTIKKKLQTDNTLSASYKLKINFLLC